MPYKVLRLCRARREPGVGGRKKLTLSQMERQQRRQQRQAGLGRPEAREKRVGGIFPPDISDEAFLEELRKMKAITPYAVASRYNLRLSVAKEVLRELERRGFLELVAASRYTRIYKVAS